MPPQKLAEITRVFQKNLTLKELKIPDDKAKEEEKAKGLFDKLGIPILVAVATFLLSSTFWANLTPKYDLQITVPPVPQGQSITLTVQTVPIEWRVEVEQWFNKRTELDSEATIRVLQDGINEVQKLELQRPGTKINLDPGTYDLEVISAETKVSDKVRVIIQPRAP